MKRASAILPAGTWDFSARAGSIALDFDRRHRRRLVLEDGELLLDLPHAVRLREGDGLRCDDGTIVAVIADPEAVMDIHAHDRASLVRIAWHLGNRHLAVQLVRDRLRIRADHVIAGMVQGLGGHVEVLQAPFDPEPGAYAEAPHSHAHDDHDHQH